MPLGVVVDQRRGDAVTARLALVLAVLAGCTLAPADAAPAALRELVAEVAP